jgi:hypothetical protein
MENSEQQEVVLKEHRHIDALQFLEVVVITTVNKTALYREDIIVADTSNGNVTITLPKSRGGKKFVVIKGSGLNVLTVQFTGGETMFGVASVVVTALGAVNKFKGVPGGYIPL